MEQVDQLNLLLGTYSFTDGSETVSEADEINEAQFLHERGNQAAEASNFDDAIKYYNEALEIDSQNVSILKSRSLAYLHQQKIEEAAKDAETILMVEPNSSLGYFLKGLVYEHINMYKPCLEALLNALDLDPSSADKLTNHIGQSVSKLCSAPSDFIDRLEAMHPYERLSEIGVILFQNKQYEVCISVLEAAGKLQTNQKGITMRILLTQANAHSQLFHTETAIGLYQKCLSLAVATHDQVYQTKSLVNLAALYQNTNDICQAIIFYEKLLDVEAALLKEAGSESSVPEYWTKDLQCGLHLNLSMGYKTIGNISSAIVHAKKYMTLVEKFGMGLETVADSHRNLGLLFEILGDYQKALQCNKEYLSLSQNSGQEKCIGQAYGCLARVYAALKNWPLSLSLHDQYITIATTSKDNKTIAAAHEIKGDTMFLKGDYQQAVEHYSKMQTLCHNCDNFGDATSLLKLAKAHKNLGQTQYSLYYCNEALSRARRFGLREIEAMAEFHAACINKDSSQHMEREEARQTFIRLIPFFEKKIAHHHEKNSQCPEEYEQQLTQCYDGIQTVLSLMSNKLGCLQYAEAHRRCSIISLPDFDSAHRISDLSDDTSSEIWDVESMMRTVSEQKATILYYSVLESLLLLWVLQPVKGLVRFCVSRASKDQTFSQQIQDLLSEITQSLDRKELINTSEARALPPRCMKTVHVISQNLRLSSEKIEISYNTSSTEENKSALQRLYDMLIAPIGDILDKMEKGSHLVVVPDKELKCCSFGALLDDKNKPLSDRFRISYISCLLLLDQVTKNEMNSVSLQNDLKLQRQQARKGGLQRENCDCSENSTPATDSPDKKAISESDGLYVNLKKVSNPRLASSRAQNTSAKTPKTVTSKESTFNSTEGLSFKEIPVSIAENNKLMMTSQTYSQGLPTGFEKMMAVHTYSTLTTYTRTNTDISSSTQTVTQFQQISDQRTALVFGCPKIKQRLKIHGKEWVPNSELAQAQKELILVAEYLGTNTVMGEQATKQELMNRLQTAEIVHIATWACLHEGLLLVTPDPVTNHADDTSHLVTVLDILNLKLRAKLVVLSSCGHSPARADQGSTMKLASSFLSAGGVCVLVCMWPIPDDALRKFLFNFYLTLQNGDFVSDALSNSIKSIQNDDRWSHVSYWACFAMIGKDTRVNVSEIKHANLDQIIDKCEEMVDSKSDKPILNPKAAVPYVPSKDESLALLQTHVKNLLLDHYKNPQIVPELVDLLDSAVKRLHTWENNYQPVQLSEVVAVSCSALALLSLLGFHFQAKGVRHTHSYIIFPHWNTDELLIPAYDVLNALTELVSSTRCVSALTDALPLTQDNISSLIDLMSITKNAPEIQLRVTDLSVLPLWHNTKTRVLLSAVGFHQIGLLLTFKAFADKQNLVSMLQMLLSFSCYKSPVLLYKLDVDLLGHAGDTAKNSEIKVHKLPSLGPILLPRNQLRMSTPWLSVIESRDEMREKIKLATSTSDWNKDHLKYLQRAKTWHQMSVVAQANETLDRFGRPASVPKVKVKVKSGSTMSQQRIPVDEERQLTISEIKQRRNHAHCVLQQRLKDIDNRRRDGIIKLYLPYVKS